MTYNVFGGTLNIAQLQLQAIYFHSDNNDGELDKIRLRVYW